MTPPHKYGHLRLVGRHEHATATPEIKQDPAPLAAAGRPRSGGVPAALKTAVYAGILAGLVGLQPLITLAAFELAHSYGPVAGLSVWAVGSVSSTYALLGHLRR